MKTHTSILEVKNLSFAYNRSKVLKELSFCAEFGDFLVIAGPNGSGKTTLIKLIFDLLETQDGEILIDGGPQSVLAAKKRMLYLASDNVLPQFLTGHEYVRLMCKLYDKAVDEDLYRNLVAYYEMEDAVGELIEQYSHGMTKKIQLISAFLIQADILVVDETLNGIDIKAKEVSKVLLKKYAEKNKLVIMCTHDLELAEQIGQRAILLYNGELCADIDLNGNQEKVSLTELFRSLMCFEDADYEI